MVGQTNGAVTLRDIARRCGVAPITVSYALRPGNRHVSAETRARVLAVAEELGYDPAAQHAARRLRLQHTDQKVLNHVIALFLADPELPHFGALFRGIYRALLRERFALLTCATEGVLPDAPDALPLAFERGDVDAAIIYCTQEELLRRLRAVPAMAGRPLVSLLSPLPGCATVEFDHQAGAYAAAAHLLSLGHRHVLHLNLEGERHIARRRLAGIYAAYREAGLDPEPHLHGVVWVDFENPAEQERLVAFVRERPQITAVLAPHDLAAVWLHRVLCRAGLRVPQDLSLVGFEDTHPIPDAAGRNLLTTVRAPLERLGEEAARLAIRQTMGEPDPAEAITLPVELVVRGTTAPARRDA